VLDGEEDDENELRSEIKHAALDDYVDRSPSCPSRETPASAM
jgi:hypothetical protein